MIWVGMGLAAAAYGLFLVWKMSFRVQEGELAVLSTFGAAEFEDKPSRQLKTYAAGLHWKKPWQEVIRVSMKEQNLELSGEKGGLHAMAEDGTVLRLDSVLRYVPVREKLAHFLFGMKRPIEHMTGVFRCLLRNEIANFRTPSIVESNPSKVGVLDVMTDVVADAGSYALIRRERGALNAHIGEFCKHRIGDRYGVRFNAVDLTDILPPDELADALNAVMHAQAETETAYFRAEGECQQRVVAAREGVAIATLRAQAVESEIDQLMIFLRELHQKGLLQMYVARRRAEAYSESRALFVKEPA